MLKSLKNLLLLTVIITYSLSAQSSPDSFYLTPPAESTFKSNTSIFVSGGFLSSSTYGDNLPKSSGGGLNGAIGTSYCFDKFQVSTYIDFTQSTYRNESIDFNIGGSGNNTGSSGSSSHRVGSRIGYLSMAYKISDLYPFVFLGAGESNYDYSSYQERNHSVWAYGFGFRYRFFTLSVKNIEHNTNLQYIGKYTGENALIKKEINVMLNGFLEINLLRKPVF